MKRPYQIEAQRAVKQLEAMAGEGNPAVQMVLPMAEMVGWLRKGVGESCGIAASQCAVRALLRCSQQNVQLLTVPDSQIPDSNLRSGLR